MDVRAAAFPQVPASVAEKTKDFVGRRWVLDQIDNWLDSGHSRRFLITGVPGSGKSALAARLVQLSGGGTSVAGLRCVGPQWLAYSHFCLAQELPTILPVNFVAAMSARLALTAVASLTHFWRAVSDRPPIFTGKRRLVPLRLAA